MIERRHLRGVVTRGPAGRTADGNIGQGPGAASGGDPIGQLASVGLGLPVVPVAPVRPAPLLDLIAG